MVPISIFTPTHIPDYLLELYQSLARQTLTTWEWVVTPNGKRKDEITSLLLGLKDPRIVVVPCPDDVKGIGAWKRFACDNCSGRILAEVDHDDWLADDCLEKVVKKQVETGAGFIYSEAIGLGADFSVETYSPIFGWVHGEHEYRGHKLPVMTNFDISPRSLSQIYWAPNHIRCWTREAYDKAGKHDPALKIADDHDLLARTYIAGVRFEGIKEVLYYQRRHAQSTSIVQQTSVAEETDRQMERHLHPLVFEWCRRESLPMYDLGGAHGTPPHPGFVPIDEALPDHRKGLRFNVLDSAAFHAAVPDGSVGVFRAVDFLEHIPIGKVPALMNMLHRKLAPMGWILSNTPAVCGPDGLVGMGAYQDPTHCSFWGPNNFWYFTNRDYAKYVPEITCRFQQVRLAHYYPSDWHRNNRVPYVASDLMALHDSRRVPGLVSI